MSNKNKPRLGQKVYVSFEGDITQETVGWLGKDSWIPEGFRDYYDECMELFYEYSYFDTHYAEWFFTLKEAKEKTMAADNSIKGFKKIRDGYWEAVYE